MALSLCVKPLAPGSRGAACFGRSRPSPVAPALRSSKPAVVCRAAEEDKITGLTFEPFTEVEPYAVTVSNAGAEESLARLGYNPECEAAVNEQINIEYNVSYVYHAMYAYFDRDNVELPGFAQFFKDNSEEERQHAELLMDYQNQRGGRVQLQSILLPQTEFGGPDAKGDALYAMELALSLEKMNFQKLRALHDIADKHNDAQMCDFIESELLADQVEDIKKVAGYVSQLRRAGKGLGVFQFDRFLQAQAEEAAEAAA
mmetsp:Transcript_42843/g.101702  ORF Transcript_42843/g.101702 Transcript_42843/m.101702 type:complete len:258 (-) Transcript_42843:237-1010(-)